MLKINALIGHAYESRYNLYSLERNVFDSNDISYVERQDVRMYIIIGINIFVD
jgi:hypothetical protein